MVNENVYVELRSDTFTQPTKEMVAEMMAAEVGDSIYNEDPTMNSNFHPFLLSLRQDFMLNT